MCSDVIRMMHLFIVGTEMMRKLTDIIRGGKL